MTTDPTALSDSDLTAAINAASAAECDAIGASELADRIAKEAAVAQKAASEHLKALTEEAAARAAAKELRRKPNAVRLTNLRTLSEKTEPVQALFATDWLAKRGLVGSSKKYYDSRPRYEITNKGRRVLALVDGAK